MSAARCWRPAGSPRMPLAIRRCWPRVGDSLRHVGAGRTYYQRRKAGGMPSMMAMRALKRRLSNVVYARMLDDQKRRQPKLGASPGGHSGNDSDSSAADSHPSTDSSDKPHPGPATSQPRTKLTAAS